MTSLARHFEAGSWGMYPILACSIVMLGAALASVTRLWACRPDTERLLAELDQALAYGDVDRAFAMAGENGGSSCRIVLAGLCECLQAQARVDAAVAAALLAELPRLRVGRTPMRATTQLATLFGLYGTVTGLRVGFSCVANVDATSRAVALAHGIGEAMNCTAFGLLVSTVGLFCAWVTEARADALARELELVAHGVACRIATHRASLRWLGRRAPLERPTYRTAL